MTNLNSPGPAAFPISHYDSTGTLLGQFGNCTGRGNGGLSDPGAIAVSANDLVYVADGGDGTITRFDSAGNYQTQWNLGSFFTDGRIHSALSIAVSPTGIVYVLDDGAASTSAAYPPDNKISIMQFFDPDAWASGTNTFTDVSVGTAGVGSGMLIGPSLSLVSNKCLYVSDTITVYSGGTLTVGGGGVLSTGQLVLDGSGCFACPGGTSTIGNFARCKTAGFTLDSSQVPLSVSGTTTVNSGCSLTVSGSSLTCNVVAVMDGGSLTVSGGTLTTNLLVAAGASPAVNVTGGTLTVAGLNNAGSLTLNYGDCLVQGRINNTGSLQVASGVVSFANDVTNTGAMQVASGATAVFTGAYSGTGIGGQGTVRFEGSFDLARSPRPPRSPATWSSGQTQLPRCASAGPSPARNMTPSRSRAI